MELEKKSEPKPTFPATLEELTELKYEQTSLRNGDYAYFLQEKGVIVGRLNPGDGKFHFFNFYLDERTWESYRALNAKTNGKQQ